MAAETVAANYAQQESPLQSMMAAMKAAGRQPEDCTLADLEGALEFHWRGAESTRALFAKMEMRVGDTVLDIGCGLGGPAMLCAKEFECQVTGIDLTPGFIEAAQTIQKLPLTNTDVNFVVGDVTAMSTIADNSIDKAFMIHVGMNFPLDVKIGMAKELQRILKPGGCFGLFDPMKGSDGAEVKYPLPFATTADDAFLATPEEYKSVLSDFDVVVDENGTPGVFGMVYTVAGMKMSPPIVTLEAVMGPSFAERAQNFGASMMSGGLTLWTLVVQKAGGTKMVPASGSWW